MNSRILARIVRQRADAMPYEGGARLLEFGVANVRAPMGRRDRIVLAYRLAYTALTGRKARR